MCNRAMVNYLIFDAQSATRGPTFSLVLGRIAFGK